MKIYDISMDIYHNMPVYKNGDEKRPVLEVSQDFSTGSAYESNICMDMHTGTHVDAPLHMIENGDTIENTELEKVVTKCRVLDLTAVEDHITLNDLCGRDITAGDFLLFKTRNSFDNSFDYNFVYLDKDAAGFLKEKGVKGIGIDSLGIERSQPGHETHKLLLGAGIVILEGLRLRDIEEGEYLLFAAPLKIKGAEAAPARAVLIEGITF